MIFNIFLSRRGCFLNIISFILFVFVSGWVFIYLYIYGSFFSPFPFLFLVCSKRELSCIILAYSSVLGGFIAPADCAKLIFE